MEAGSSCKLAVQFSSYKVIELWKQKFDQTDEESYASEDLEEMLEELAIAEEKELTNAGDSLDNTQWNDFANKQQSFTFTGKSGRLMDLLSNISPGEVLSLFLDEKVISLLVAETKIWEFLVREWTYSENTRPVNERKKTRKVSHHLEIQRISRASLLEGSAFYHFGVFARAPLANENSSAFCVEFADYKLS
ncbi:hypothetical protein WN51_08677 [Melipona quadrifasciata]|uniref:Uncharacterized protein n=1 Tax=Melipona quadrifasciata TaxID=166423 RepID=A0A0N0BJC1_9HYME|nr:hypothetical protein WN51_08677 [Melipona quadrifasciata]